MKEEQELEKEVNPILNGLESYFKFNLNSLISKTLLQKSIQGKI